MALFGAMVAIETDPTLADDPGVAPFLSPYLRWWGGYHEGSPSLDRWELAVMRRREEAVGALHEAGIRIGAGTDAPQLPGALHLELEELVAAGLSPLEAITAATSNAARILGAEEEIGTIEVGKRADLLLLDADPLEDVRNTRRIWKVIQGGRVVDRERLVEWSRENQQLGGHR